LSSLREDVKARIDAIEESYEFFLAYAAQGASGDAASSSGGQLRDFISRAEAALDRMGDCFRALLKEEDFTPVDVWADMVDVVDRDASAALAAVRLVGAQESISSQLVDNLNANIHLRALLTDLFLVDDLIGA
jgi:hypothetical protein